MAGSIWRATVILHRYLGIAIGLLMVMWFVSGMVMMYVPYSQVQEAQRLHLQPAIAWQSCCNYGRLRDDTQITRAQVEDYLGTPALRLRVPGQSDFLFDLVLGERISIDADTARKVARQAIRALIGRDASITDYAQVSLDQFTLGVERRDRPFHRFTFDDPNKTTIYVSGTAGQIVTWTTVGHRFWNWLGTIPHFLYFQSLRVQQELWTQIVIWTSLLGTFLTAVGIILGVMQFRRGKGRTLSPYRGWFYMHHVIGLVFGVLTLTWVFSGLISMNPWGFLEDRGRGEASLVEGPAPRWKDIKASLEVLRTRLAGSGVVSITSAPLDGRLYWMAIFNEGSVKRLDISGQVAPTSEGELVQAARRIAGDRTIAEQSVVNEEDAYYYARERGRSEEFVLPVYRVILRDDQQTRYYLDPGTGALVQRADSTGRWKRWLFNGLHRLDFVGWMRARPFRDALMWFTLLGGLAVSVTGVYLAIRRVRSDIIVLMRSMHRLIGGRRKPTEVVS